MDIKIDRFMMETMEALVRLGAAVREHIDLGIGSRTVYRYTSSTSHLKGLIFSYEFYFDEDGRFLEERAWEYGMKKRTYRFDEFANTAWSHVRWVVEEAEAMRKGGLGGAAPSI